MATTINLTAGASWTRVASGRGDARLVKVEGPGSFFLAVTVGLETRQPDLAPLTGHPVDGMIDIPIVAAQHLWVSAPAPMQLTVT